MGRAGMSSSHSSFLRYQHVFTDDFFGYDTCLLVSHPMASPLDISVAEAREIVLGVSRDNGWHEPELEAAADPRILASIASLRRQVADIVETYFPINSSWISQANLL